MALQLLKTVLLKKEIEKKKRLGDKVDTAGYDNPNVGNICRVCGGNGDIDIFSSYRERNLAEDIRLCSGVPVYINDGFPSCLCDECHTLLQYAVKFRDMCRRSTEKLLKIKLDQTIDKLPKTEIKAECETQDYDVWNYAPLSPEADDTQQDIASTTTCETCQQDFIDVTTFKQHLRECKRLLRQYKKEKSRKSHTNGTKEHLCETCGKALSSIHSLISHRTIHQNIFPFKCNLCQYKGKTAGLLRTHRKIHFSDKPHACTICPKAFKTSSNLRKHLQVHKGQTESVQCVLCDKTLRNKETLRGHVSSVHAHRPLVSCNLCGKQFKGMRALYKHRTKVHNWRAEYTGRLPAYMLCQPDEPPPVLHAATHLTLLTEQ